MRNFIKNHTPEWWDGWCWFALVALVWSIGWAVFGNNPYLQGFDVGMAIFWVGFILHRAIDWMNEETLRVCRLGLRSYRELNRLNNKIIARQRETIALKNETIKVQNDHINYLQEHRAAR